MTGLLAALLAAAPHAFDGHAAGWVVLDPAGDVLAVHELLAGKRPTDAALAPDGEHWAFIADGKLWLWHSAWDAPREVPRTGDVLETPAFNADSTWVYFIQNVIPPGGAKRLPHGPSAPMRYAQVWKVKAEGGPAQQLTRTAGCRMWPTPMADGKVVVTHATCRGGRAIELLGRDLKESIVLDNAFENAETAVAPDGTRVAFIRDAPTGMELGEVSLTTREEKRWLVLPERTTRYRLAWHPDGRSLWLQLSDGIYRAFADGTLTSHFKFSNLEKRR